ncbi:MAG: 30S ribosomal protein S20 [Candidatus Omnitrophota bacterium]
MPILHASYKDIKKTAKRTLRNKILKSELKTEIKKFAELLSSGKTEEAKKAISALISKIDRARTKGVIHKNTASRKKSRLMKKLASLGKS